MRPRHKAAENLCACGSERNIVIASMRPRHKAAENVIRIGFDEPVRALLQ